MRCVKREPCPQESSVPWISPTDTKSGLVALVAVDTGFATVNAVDLVQRYFSFFRPQPGSVMDSLPKRWRMRRRTVEGRLRVALSRSRYNAERPQADFRELRSPAMSSRPASPPNFPVSRCCRPA